MMDALLLSIGLAMDAAAVAAARSVLGLTRGRLVLLALAFGVAQSGMAALGLLLGKAAAQWLAQFGTWIAFGVLAVLGVKMIVEGARSPVDDIAGSPREVDLKTGAILALATSVDALATGVTLPVLDSPIALSITLIGVVTFVASLAAGLGANALGVTVGRRLGLLGGVALLAIGVKLLVS